MKREKLTKFESARNFVLPFWKRRLSATSCLFCAFCLSFTASHGESSAEEIYEQAQEKYADGDDGAARALLLKISDEDFKRIPEAERRLGLLLYKDGKVREAVRRFERAWKNGNQEALRYVAQAKIELNEPEWLEENRAALMKNISRDIKTLDVFMAWYVLRADLTILSDGFGSAEKAKILEDEETLKNTLVAFRHLIETGDEELLKGK